ncbi:aminomethyl-transferring glycine dehydrogenase subunit GcvPA [Bremerella cremea]|uniref:Probable glycine dehydrogenase (decarboxylating) subunit 1 n=1 Tax=Blastopirellula marina TaxID=124 RepID=A0A2S8FVU2_9BACT|nr:MULTISPECIES: aminomethyl-transferring glycine dehydrogenase subunit GcvPA [Pirellulaceae]PQO35944.1 aminomethyl-transferring glycine dehydrogenase [Blastopirellula marina]RCS48621.1 aminomethyl-transferring glycine dehydrogenase subunit GcvPA [Bremerella cremea]
MTYLYNTPDDQHAMLKAIGVESIEELFSTIPDDLRLKRDLDLPPQMGELELTQHLSALAGKNASPATHACFLGGGSYDHFVPAAVDALASRGEFYTSYTPYQPEVSQGNLQAMFEYQTLICDLTGMDLSNASLYDGGSALAEAVIMALNTGKRGEKVVVLGTVHPEYRLILQTYFTHLGIEIVEIPCVDGIADLSKVEEIVDADTNCVVVQSPNFFGGIEDVAAIAEIAHKNDAVVIQSFDPISLGLLKRPGDLGADIAVAEGHSLGSPMQYGGPYLGIMACNDKFVRRLPGRIVGQTEDRRGKRCWVLTLQTREQHIRREKATSNICTNQGLFALRASIYLALLGPGGMKQCASLCTQKAHYAQAKLTEVERLEPVFTGSPFFKEFVLRDTQGNVEGLLAEAREAGFLGGVPLGQFFPEMDDCFLVCVTEKRTKQEIDALARTFSLIHSGGSTIHA